MVLSQPFVEKNGGVMFSDVMDMVSNYYGDVDANFLSGLVVQHAI